MPLYYASLEEAWYTPPIAGLDDVLVGAGWARVHWCEMEDWQDGARWCDKWHPTLDLAAEFLQRIMAHVPFEKVLIVGDSTLTWDMGERGEYGFRYNWDVRDPFLAKAGGPRSAIWAVPGVGLKGIVKQIGSGIHWERPDAIVLVGGWNEKEGSAEDFAKALADAIDDAMAWARTGIAAH